ncbi:MAG: prepilin-type N-terminal cleavage/methylation domain-containing protein [Bacteroidetes bacterium]|nr:prepilin-type N-terminal cleavage/methylation domain-containing protein [Bacteroidota bacterium]
MKYFVCIYNYLFDKGAKQQRSKKSPVPALLLQGKACGRGYTQIPSGSSKNQNYLHTKLAAFTLLELLVGMVISSIVIAAAFSAWSIISRQHAQYRTRHEASTEASFFSSRLRRDFAQAAAYSGQPNTLTLQLRNQTVQYKNVPPVVVRSIGLHTDTFRVEVANWTFTADSTGIARLQLEMNVNHTPLPLLLTRQRSAAEQLSLLSNPPPHENGY